MIFILVGSSLETAKAASPFEDGVAAFHRKDYATALNLWLPLVEKDKMGGTAFNLGILYENGWGIPKNYNEAFKYYKISAERGFMLAFNNLATFYRNGFGVEKNLNSAVYWYEQGVEKGDKTAFNNLIQLANENHPVALDHVGALYLNGRFVPKNYQEAFKYYSRAAKQNVSSSQMQLAFLYATGQGVKADVVKAYVWWNVVLGINDFEKDEKDNIIRQIKENTQIAEKNMSSQQLQKAKAILVDCSQRAYLNCNI